MNSFLENRTAVDRTDSPALIAPRVESAFQPLFPVAPAQKAAAQGMPAQETRMDDGSKVELIQAGGRVERIIVTCSCCNRIELQCQY
jgi:hypothetical protein